MKRRIIYTSQTRLKFNMGRLLDMGIGCAYVTPFSKNNEGLAEPEIILSNLEKLSHKAKAAAKKD